MSSWSRFILFFVLFLFFIPTPCLADKEKTFIDDLSARGITYEVKDGQLNVTIAEEKAVAAIPELQSKGILPKNIMPDDLKRMHVTAAVEAVGMSYTVVLVHSIFMNDPNLKSLHVVGYLDPANSSIFSGTKPCFSFDVSRELYDSINWDVVSTRDFMAQTSNFKLEDWCRDKIQSEISDH